MPTPTARIGIPKPLGEETVTRESFNTIWDLIDTAMVTHNLNETIRGIWTRQNREIMDKVGTASSSNPGQQSHDYVLRGSGWAGTVPTDIDVIIRNIVSSASQYRLAILNNTGTEVFSVDQSGIGILPGGLTVRGTSLFVSPSNGRVGVGTTSPASAFHVVGDITVTGLVDGRDVRQDGTSLDEHLANEANPHRVTARQTGSLVSIDSVDNAGGNVDLEAGPNIRITPNNAAKVVRIEGTGTWPNADTVDGAHAGTGANNVLKLSSTGFIPLGNIPPTLTGKSADMVDGAHAGTGANNVLKLDSSGRVPLGNIPATLTGKSADLLDGYHASNFAFAGHKHAGSDITSAVASATEAGNADTVDGRHASNQANQIPVYDSNRRVYDSNRLGGRSLGTAQGQIPYNGAGLASGLNADMVDGYHASTMATGNTLVVRNSSGQIQGPVLTIEARTSDPPNPVNGQIWLRTDL